MHKAMEWKAHEMAAGRYPMAPGGPPPDGVRISCVMSARAENAPRASAAPADACAGGTVTRRTVKLIRPPFGNSRDVPGMMRSTP